MGPVSTSLEKDDFPGLVEQRRHFRVPVERRAVSSPGEGDAPSVEGHTLDMSLSGVRLKAAERISPGGAVELVICNGEVDTSLVVAGTGVWTARNEDRQDYETGVLLPELTPEQRKIAAKLIGCPEEFLTGEQRRRYTRIESSLLVKLGETEGVLTKRSLAEVRDISLGGMQAEVAAELSKGVRCTAEIFLPRENEPARVEARIVEIRQAGPGCPCVVRFAFEAFDEEARKKIVPFLSAEMGRSAYRA